MPRVMIVDDEEHIRTLYKLELEDEGYEVIALDSGKGLVEKIRETSPQVVVLDIKMVDVSGLDVLQDIRREFYDLPVILCSAYGSFRGDVKTIAADYYVVKSSNLGELKKRIKSALESRPPARD